MRNLTARRYRSDGFALLVVLLIVATISILALGFATKADRELSFGENVEVRMQMDYLSLTGLNYAKSLLLNPQNVDTGNGGHWEGGSGLQIEGGSDYFDVTVSRHTIGNTRRCSYDITCGAYRQAGSDTISAREMTGEVRFDPCIGYVQLNNNRLEGNVTVKGDVYCGRDMLVYGTIDGDLSTVGGIGWLGNNITGDKRTGVAECPVSVPALMVDDYRTVYYIGSQSYMVEELTDAAYENLVLEPSESNPAGIFYRDGNLDLQGTVKITGMLVVKNDLHVKGAAITINSVKNFPALLVGNEIKMDVENSSLDVFGFTQVWNNIDANFKNGCKLSFTGALHILSGTIKDTNGIGIGVTVIADPMAASLKTWSNGGSTVEYWMPAGGAYFKNIARN